MKEARFAVAGRDHVAIAARGIFAPLSRAELMIAESVASDRPAIRLAQERAVSPRTLANQMRLLARKLSDTRRKSGAPPTGLRSRAARAIERAVERPAASEDWWGLLMTARWQYVDVFQADESCAVVLAKGTPRPLSARELQTALLYAAGTTLKEIAADLSVSPSSVNINLRRALRKMGMPSRHAFRGVQQVLALARVSPMERI